MSEKPKKPYSLKLSMDEDEAGELSQELMHLAGETTARLMLRTLEHGGRVTLECDARNVQVQWVPVDPFKE